MGREVVTHAWILEGTILTLFALAGCESNRVGRHVDEPMGVPATARAAEPAEVEKPIVENAEPIPVVETSPPTVDGAPAHAPGGADPAFDAGEKAEEPPSSARRRRGRPQAKFASRSKVAEGPVGLDAFSPAEQPIEEETTPPASELDAPQKNLEFVRQVLRQAEAFYAANPRYTCRITRQERVGMRVLPKETLLMNFIERPRSVHYRWLDDDHLGRECLWVEGKNDGKLISLGGKGDFLLNGKQIKVDPEGALARSKSRYPISESGIHRTVARLSKTIALQMTGDESRGTVRFVGTSRRADLDRPAYRLTQTIPAGIDPYFPKGASREWYFDPKTGQLLLMTGRDSNGDFLEYYRYDRFISNNSLQANDFDPRVLWPGRRAEEPSDPDAARERIAEKDEDLPK